MALEQYSNNASTTTSGSIDNSTDPVLFSVASVSGFPSAGNFRILIDSEILKVTNVSGTTFIAARAQEGTAIAGHSGGATLTHILTAGSLKQIVGEFHLADAIGNRPAAGTPGRLFFPTGGGPIERDTGSTWELWAHGLGPFTPPISDFTTWLNQGSATISTSNGFSYLSLAGVEAANNDIKARVKTLPSTTFTMTLVFALTEGPGNQGVYGILARNSGDGKIFTHTVAPNVSGGSFADYTFSGLSNAFNTGIFADAYNKGSYGPLFFLRLRGDGTTYFFDHSNDGVNWINNRQVTIAGSYVPSPDQIGFYMIVANARSNQTTGMSVYHAVLG